MDLNVLDLNTINHSTPGFVLLIIICSSIDVSASVLTNSFKVMVKKMQARAREKEGGKSVCTEYLKEPILLAASDQVA